MPPSLAKAQVSLDTDASVLKTATTPMNSTSVISAVVVALELVELYRIWMIARGCLGDGDWIANAEENADNYAEGEDAVDNYGEYHRLGDAERSVFDFSTWKTLGAAVVQ